MTRFVIGNVGVFPFSGSAEVTGNLQVSGAGNHPGAVLEVMGPATGPGLRVTGNAEITGDLLVKGTTVTVDSATNLKVEGELSSSGPLVVTNQAQIKGNLLLSGSSTFGGVLSASTIVASGSTILKDTLNVSGATTLATTLNANGDVQAAKDVHVVGGLTVSGSLQVGLFSSSAPIQTSDQMRVGETLHVSGALFAGGVLSGSTHFQTAGDMRVGENLDVSGSVRANTFTFAPGGNKMTFQSDSDYNRDIHVGGSVTVSGTYLRAEELQLLGGSRGHLSASGDSVFLGGVVNKSTVKVSGALTAGGDIEAAKDIHIAGGLTVSGAFTLGTGSMQQVNVARGLTVDEVLVNRGILKQTGSVTLAGLLSSSAPIQTSNELRVGEDLSVSGNILNASFSGDANFINDVSISGSLFISSSVASGSSYPLLRIDHHNLTGSVPVLFVTGSGIVGIGTDDPRSDSANTNALHILGGGAGSDNGIDPVINTTLTLENNDHVGIQFLFPNQKAGQLTWGTNTSNRKATFYYDSNHNVYNFEGTSYGGSRAVQFHAGADGVNIGSSNAAHMANNKKKASLHISSSTKGIDTGGAVMLRIDHAEAMISGSLTNNTGTIMLVTGSGRVGILTETPQEALDVGDNSDVSARIGRAHIGYDGTTSDYAVFAHRDNANTTDFALQQRANGTTVVNAKAGQDVSLRVANSNALVIAGASNSNVGINTGSPAARLHVVANTGEKEILRCDGEDLDNVLYVSGTGQVGIGTSSPAASLSIVGDLSASTNIQAAADVRVGGDLLVSGTLSLNSLNVNDGDVTNVGTLEVDTVQSDADAAGLNINFDGNTGTNKLTLKDNLASALDITEGSNSYIKFVTTNSGEEIQVSKKITTTGLIASSGSGGVHIGNIAAIAAHSASTYLAVSGADEGAATLVQFSTAKDNNGQQPSYNLVQDANGRSFQSWNMAPQTSYAMYFNISNGANSTMFIANGTIISQAPIRLTADFSSSFPIQTSNEMRVGETLVVSSSVGIGDIAGTTLGTTGSHLHIRSADDAAIRLEADTDNATETHNAYLFMTQDGGATRGLVGLNGNAAADPAGVFLANAASNAMIVGARTAGSPLQLVTNNRVKMTITDDGLVGLGQDFNGTINPVALLHISGGGDDQGSSANAPMMRVDYGDLDNIFHISRSGSVGINVVPTHALTVAGAISGSENLQVAGQARVGETLHVSGAINGASISVGSVDVNDGNIANVGDIDADSVSVADAANGLNIDFSGANTGTGLITIADDLAAALTVKEGSNEIVKIVSTDGSEEIVLGYKLDLGDNDIENVGTISADVIQPDAAATGLDIQFEGNTTKNKMTLTDNLADALNITEAGNSYLKFTTTNSSEAITAGVEVKGTIFSGSTSIHSQRDLKAHDANIEAMLKVSGNVRLGLSSSTAVTVNTDTLDSYKAPQFYILSGTTTVKLPGNHPAGTWFVFKAGNAHFGPTADTITLSATAGDTIDGSTTYTIQSPFASVNCVSDGANWFIW